MQLGKYRKMCFSAPDKWSLLSGQARHGYWSPCGRSVTSCGAHSCLLGQPNSRWHAIRAPSSGVQGLDCPIPGAGSLRSRGWMGRFQGLQRPTPAPGTATKKYSLRHDGVFVAPRWSIRCATMEYSLHFDGVFMAFRCCFPCAAVAFGNKISQKSPKLQGFGYISTVG